MTFLNTHKIEVDKDKIIYILVIASDDDVVLFHLMIFHEKVEKQIGINDDWVVLEFQKETA